MMRWVMLGWWWVVGCDRGADDKPQYVPTEVDSDVEVLPGCTLGRNWIYYYEYNFDDFPEAYDIHMIDSRSYVPEMAFVLVSELQEMDYNEVVNHINFTQFEWAGPSEYTRGTDLNEFLRWPEVPGDYVVMFRIWFHVWPYSDDEPIMYSNCVENPHAYDPSWTLSDTAGAWEPPEQPEVTFPNFDKRFQRWIRFVGGPEAETSAPGAPSGPALPLRPSAVVPRVGSSIGP